LCGVAVAASLVPPSIGDAGHSLDPKVAVAEPKIPGQRGRGTVDVDAVITGPDGDIGLKQAAGGGRLHQDPVDVAVPDQVPPNDGVDGRWGLGLEGGDADASVTRSGDEVACDQVAGATLEGDADAAADLSVLRAARRIAE
jgi:hypothetical protein